MPPVHATFAEDELLPNINTNTKSGAAVPPPLNFNLDQPAANEYKIFLCLDMYVNHDMIDPKKKPLKEMIVKMKVSQITSSEDTILCI